VADRPDDGAAGEGIAADPGADAALEAAPEADDDDAPIETSAPLEHADARPNKDALHNRRLIATPYALARSGGPCPAS